MVSVWLLFGVENTPSANLMSATSTLSMWAAIALPLASTFSAAMVKAEPENAAEREPPVPSAKNTWSVSPWI